MSSTSLLPSLTHLRLAGPDCGSFLQGYVTTDVDTLTTSWSLSAFTNLKGRVFATVLLRRADRELIDLIVSADIAEGLASFLSKYLMFAKCDLTAVDGTPMLSQRSEGCPATEGENHNALPASMTAGAHQVWHLHTAADYPDGGTTTPDGTDEWLALLIKARLGWIGAQASEQHLPQMLGLIAHDAVSFSKGCYLGQEIVARVEHRGSVKRQLVALDYTADDGSAVPTVGTPLLSDNGKEVGNLVVVQASTGQALAVTAGDPTTLTSTNPGARYVRARRQ